MYERNVGLKAVDTESSSFLCKRQQSEDCAYARTHTHAKRADSRIRADENIKHCRGMLCPPLSPFTVQLMQLV